MAIAGKKRGKEQQRPWHDLPRDLMEIIMRRLYYADHLRVTTVCKSWHSMYGVPPLKQLPLLMAFEDDSWFSCKLYDPVYKKSGSIQVNDCEQSILRGKPVEDIEIHACRHGWLLMSDTRNPTDNLFLFTPFANGNIIRLPDLKSSFQIATFTYPPTNPECVYFALQSIPNDGMVRISICTCHGVEWDTRIFNWKSPLQYSFSNVIYMEREEKFFCSTIMGTVGIYDLNHHNWNILQISEPPWRDRKDWSNVYLYMVESSGGEILLTKMLGDGCSRNLTCRLNRDKLIWEVPNSLDEHVLFLGGCNVLLSTTLVRSKSKRIHAFYSSRVFRCRSRATRHFRLQYDPYYTCKKYYGPLSLENCTKIWIERPTYGIPYIQIL